MTANHKLKDDCKNLLDTIRKQLPTEERQKMEPLLRKILDVTKELVANAKVSPTEHEAALSKSKEVQRELELQRNEVGRLQHEIKAVLRQAEKTAEVRQRLDAFVETTTGRLVEAAQFDLSNLMDHVRCVGDGPFVSVLEKMASESDGKHPYYRKSLMVLCVCLNILSLDDGEVTEGLKSVCEILSS